MLQFEVVRGTGYNWIDFWPKLELAIAKHDPTSVLSISTTESPKNHADCIGVIWLMK